MPEGLTLGASGLVSRQMKRGERGSVPASRTFAEMFECEPADATRRANGWTKKSDVQLVEGLHETDNDEQ